MKIIQENRVTGGFTQHRRSIAAFLENYRNVKKENTILAVKDVINNITGNLSLDMNKPSDVQAVILSSQHHMENISGVSCRLLLHVNLDKTVTQPV